MHIIAQSKNGTGKTGAFTIGSILRIDPKNPKLQVVAIGHTREMVNQISEVYKKLTKYSDITVDNAVESGKFGAHIVVCTLGKFIKFFDGRVKPDISALKCVVVDEADHFFSDKQNKADFAKLHKILKDRVMGKEPLTQYILFSATYPEEIFKDISEFIEEAQQIRLKNENLKLDHVKQFKYRCPKKGKINFVEEIFEACASTQTVIFVNTVSFAETLLNVLKKRGFDAYIIFGKMSNEERDEFVEKFRRQEINVIITTNLLSRGIDVPEIQVVINFDVPK